MTPNTLVVCAVLLSLASCKTSPSRDRDPTWALIQNPTDSQPPYVWRRADELPVTTRTVLTGQALASPSAFAAYWRGTRRSVARRHISSGRRLRRGP
jgi:hypothetical protein